MRIIEVDSVDRYKYEFSFCTLVTDILEYEGFISTCENKGFNENNSEFLYIDNSESNKYDAYSGINKLISLSSGKYIIICHQDIRFLYDDINKLRKCIANINILDYSWGVLGNAGATGWQSKLHIRITDPLCENVSTSSFPIKVKSLDENFLLVRNGLNIGVSNDLNGFHLYGADICLQADIRGSTCYVIDFHLKHLSRGYLSPSFYICEDNLIKKYSKILQDRYIKTTCTIVFISKSAIKNKIFNSVIKRIVRWLQS